MAPCAVSDSWRSVCTAQQFLLVHNWSTLIWNYKYMWNQKWVQITCWLQDAWLEFNSRQRQGESLHHCVQIRSGNSTGGFYLRGKACDRYVNVTTNLLLVPTVRTRRLHPHILMAWCVSRGTNLWFIKQQLHSTFYWHQTLRYYEIWTNSNYRPFKGLN